jgi:itaconyl-CoA hydratase
MFPAFVRQPNGHWRESSGLPFEAFAPGQVFHHRPGLTVSQQDNSEEALVTLNQAAIHTDAAYAEQTEFHRPLVVSTFTLQRAVGMGWKTFGRRRRITEFPKILLVAPVFAGDTLYAETRIVATAPDPDDTRCGLVNAETLLARADGETLAIVAHTQSIFRQGKGPFSDLAYEDGRVMVGPAGMAAYRACDTGGLIEVLGIAFEALTPGLRIEHRPGFTFSWAQSRYRSAIAGDHAVVQMDPAFAALAGHGAAAISETWVLSTVVAATTRAFGQVVANLAWENVRFPVPAQDGDTMFALSEVLHTRPSASRPGQGIVHVQTTATSQKGALLCEYDRKLLMYRAP